jgi:membrane-associated protease RseP (regulator of RpoE activity)
MNNTRWISTLGIAVLAAPLWAQTAKAPEKPALKSRPTTPAEAYVRVPFPPGTSRSYMGVDVADITSDRVAPLKLKEERGVEITMVDQDAPAGKAGLKEHDVILEYNGTRVESEEELRRLIRETPPGRTITLGISRDGQPLQVKVTLGDRQKVWAKARTFNFVMPKIEVPEVPDIEVPSFDIVMRSYSPSTGIMIDNLTPQLGQYFGVPNGEGVLIRSVEKGSAAEQAGFKAGDVIVKVNDDNISDRTDWRRAIRGRKDGKLNVTVIRDKKEQVLTLTLPQRREEGRLQGFYIPQGDWDMIEFPDEKQEKELKELKKEMPKIKEQMKKLREDLADQAKEQAELARRQALRVREQQRTVEQQQLILKQQIENNVRDAVRQIRMQYEI